MQMAIGRITTIAAATVLVAACSGAGDSQRTFNIAGIPDQSASRLARRYDALTEYLTRRLGVEVKYVPTVDYAATVAAFKHGDVHMAWFGGLTGVQARRLVPGSEAIAQRPRDAEFHSKLIVQSELDVHSLQDLSGLTFTFGSESSTSGHLMPWFFLVEAGVEPERDFKSKPNFSGSHDKTWKLVESGAFQAGALSEAVWEAAVEQGRVDTSKVRVFYTTPSYFDYNWTVRGDVDDIFGSRFRARVQQALLAIGEGQREILGLYSASGFVETSNENYAAILEVARSLEIIE